MSLDPSTFLDGPRGRRLCLEILLDAARQSDTPVDRDATQAVFWAAHALAENPGTLIHIGGGDEPFVEPEVSSAQAAAALAEIPTPEITPARIDRALEVAVDLAAYWQPPSGEDVLAAVSEMRPVLAPVAAAVARSGRAASWTRPVDHDAQSTVTWEGASPFRTDTEAVLSEWRANMAATEIQFAASAYSERLSGPWWSTPPGDLPRTTPSRGAEGPVGMSLVEDSLGWTSARTRTVTVPDGEVIEIDGPDAWASLCHRHPLVVTASRRNVWRWTTGREGVWVQPDWSALAKEAVGVHLTIAGYVATAGRVVELGGLGASVLAGWGPDETFWFGEVTPRGEAEEWTREDSAGPGAWRRA